jgi:hypothetical protein
MWMSPLWILYERAGSFRLLEACDSSPVSSADSHESAASYIDFLINLKTAVDAARWLYVLAGKQLLEHAQGTHLVTAAQ